VLEHAKPTEVGWYFQEGGVHQPTLVGFALLSAEFIRRGSAMCGRVLNGEKCMVL
jgi:hypothetical protein